jgi:hypothetical protein
VRRGARARALRATGRYRDRLRLPSPTSRPVGDPPAEIKEAIEWGGGLRQGARGRNQASSSAKRGNATGWAAVGFSKMEGNQGDWICYPSGDLVLRLNDAFAAELCYILRIRRRD